MGDGDGRRRRDGHNETRRGHVMVGVGGCVGTTLAHLREGAGQTTVMVDLDEARLVNLGQPVVVGDATSDDTLHRAGITRARALVTALDTDAANLFVTVSARALRPDLFIVARVRSDDSTEQLRRAGSARGVNPQSLGGARVAAFVLPPPVAE